MQTMIDIKLKIIEREVCLWLQPTLAAGQKKSFVKFLENLRKARRGGSTRLADWNVAFAAFDLDRSGQFSMEES